MKTGKKTELLRKLVSTKGGDFDMVQFDTPLPMPLDPRIMCKKVIASKCRVFSSATLPMTLTFEAEIIEVGSEETEAETNEEEKNDNDLD